jgi:hypothetical protein
MQHEWLFGVPELHISIITHDMGHIRQYVLLRN